MEETVNRGLLQSAFAHKGPLTAILISAVFFTALHPPSSYWFVFLMGLVIGTQFWLTGSLWTTIITHATYNGLAQLDESRAQSLSSRSRSQCCSSWPCCVINGPGREAPRPRRLLKCARDTLDDVRGCRDETLVDLD
jgi:hypothetical protein